MPTFLIIALCIVGAVAAVLGAGFAVVCAADAEGRAGNSALAGLGVAALGALSFIGFGIWALVRWLA